MDSREGILYPLLVLGAVSVIVLSFVAVLAILNYAPSRGSSEACVACGVVEAVQRPAPAARASKSAGGDKASGPAVDENDTAGPRYAVRVRMEDGSAKILYRQRPPQIDVGDKVKLVDGAIVALD